jgi:hypothetical protein
MADEQLYSDNDNHWQGMADVHREIIDYSNINEKLAMYYTIQKYGEVINKWAELYEKRTEGTSVIPSAG